MEIMATSKNYGKKKIGLFPGYFMGKNLIMEKSDVGIVCLN